MLTINPIVYEKLAELLVEAIAYRSYFSEVICFEEPETDYSFSSTLMIYYRTEELPEGPTTVISNIVPIWWEFRSTTDYGEQLNDFDFAILKNIIC